MPAITGGRRRSLRWAAHDYASAAGYMVTLCTHQRVHLFGSIVSGVVRLTALGQLAYDLWIQTRTIRPEIVLDAFVIMPDHMHAIILLPESGQPRKSGRLSRPPRSLGSLIAGYKSSLTSQANTLLRMNGLRIWQRNYYETVIRSTRALERMRRYIEANPARWAKPTPTTLVGERDY